MNPRIPCRFKLTNADRFNYAMGRIYSRQIIIVLTLNGRIDEERMARTVRLLIDAEPVLGCRLVAAREPYWERRNDLNSLSLCKVTLTENIGEELRNIVNAPMNPVHDPLFTVRILRGTTDTIVLRLEHTASDGGGAKEVLYLLANIYSQLGKEPDYRSVPNNRGDRSFNQLFWSLDFKKKCKLIKPCHSATPVAVFPYRSPDRNDWDIAVRFIRPTDFQQLKAYAREHGATINDLLLAAFFRAFFKMAPCDPEQPFPVNIPVDLRAFTRRKRAGAVTNLVTGYFPAVIPKECTDFQQTLRAVQTQMALWKRSDIQLDRGVIVDLLGHGPGIEFYEGFMDSGYTHSEQTGKIVPVMTNLGVLDQKKLRFDDHEVVDAYFLGPVTYPPFFTVCISTFEETMTLMAGYCREPEGDQPVEEFLELMKAELERAYIM